MFDPGLAAENGGDRSWTESVRLRTDRLDTHCRADADGELYNSRPSTSEEERVTGFPAIDGQRIEALLLDAGWVDAKTGKVAVGKFAEHAGIAARTVDRALNGSAGKYAIASIARVLNVAPVNLFNQREVDRWLGGLTARPPDGWIDDNKADAALSQQEETMTDLVEFFKKFNMLPNEYKGKSVEVTFSNRSLWRDDGKTLYWRPMSPTHAHALVGAVPGSTIQASVRLIGLEKEVCTAFAKRKIAKEILDAPADAVFRVRVKTVYTTTIDESTRYNEPGEMCYEEIKGIMIKKILAVHDSTETD